MDVPDEYWGGPGMGGTCYYGASALAIERLMRAFDYTLVAFDRRGLNTFFVLNSELGAPPSHEVHTFALVTPTAIPGIELWTPNHGDCSPMLWVHVADSPGLAGTHPYRHMRPELLKHTPDGRGGRKFESIKLGAVLTMHQHRHQLRSGWWGGA